MPFQAGHEFRVLELLAFDVDADTGVEALCPPLKQLGQGGFDHPVAQCDGERVLLQQRDELGRWHQPFAGVLPADQGFEAGNLAVGQPHLGLVVQPHFAFGQRLAHFIDAHEALARRFVFQRVEHVVAVLARQFGQVHGLVGLAQQLLGLHRVGLREQRHADARRQVERLAIVKCQWCCHRLQHALHRQVVVLGCLQPWQDDGEFVTSDARQVLTFAHGCGQPLAHFDQQAVAGVSAQLGIDGGKPVQVDVGHGQLVLQGVCLAHADPQ